ncbi:MAG: dTDP-4-dehydrorhamnose reductase [Alphaproteobacteria bacterium]|nr:dTDP-4-dehydrorhamnose reductase [Alphaproteobacteria bacterium]
MKILLLGKGGQVGWELQRSLAPLGELIALDRHSRNHCGDLANLQGLTQTLQALRPDIIVNAAAYTAVDKAESEPEQARLINATAPGCLAQEAHKIGAWLVHYSTDYVFDGSGAQAWREIDVPAPINVYGQTKLEGEQLVAQHCPRHLIFRTSWVYAARGNNFAKTMLRLAHERERLTVIDDQWGAPTGADLLADVTAHALRQAVQQMQQGRAHIGTDAGIYHLAASGETTWSAYATHVLNHAKSAQPPAKLRVQEVVSVPASAFPTPARRPYNSRLNTRKLESTFGLALPDWRLGVDRMLAEVL